MIKHIVGIAVITIMIGLAVVGFIGENKSETNSSKMSNGQPEGAGIVAPDQTGIEQGETAPDFTLETLSGETLQLSDLRGKKVILNFWASWCGPCKKEMPEMQKFYEEHKKEVEIVALNLTGREVGVSNVKKYIDKFGYTYPVPLDEELKVQEMYGVTVIPTTYFINTNGKIQLPRKAGPMTYEYLEEMVNKLD
ncbi:TlpA family protein disulfide reductase [Virgibacillus kekensis]|uniref:TlpA family protein disulfide reductase n=1 Tax=Virgibacillus kekensis TaxID=202261 RepID=A0ABV9DFR4_9BACI